ncbi:MAG TPA: A/G-specific adenine glycosylase [Flavisolibacter sp.]|nr:A/G-specific adenine glycosylase [Flavisolibacter sp.]
MNGRKKSVPIHKNGKPEESEGLFAKRLLIWNKNQNTRQMPWKGEKDPYKIWLSEIILQQTRVEQGLKYYENFIKTFPDVHALAKAPEEKVFKLWEGLGYYSRCRNLITTAKFISKDLKGNFPKDFESILQLKGVGNYTASAIASFAYNLPYAVLDGNVFRVLSRIFDIEIPIDSTEGKKTFSALAQTILPQKKAGEYNQAIMDFGAVICKPYPECKICFFNDQCKAYLKGKQDLLPVKEKKIKIRERWLNYLILKNKDQVLIHQRTSNDIWQQLFEFLLIETEKALPPKKILRLFEQQYGFTEFYFESTQTVKQKLSHQLIHFSFLQIELKQKETVPGFLWVKNSELNKYAFPKSLQEFVTSHLK